MFRTALQNLQQAAPAQRRTGIFHEVRDVLDDPRRSLLRRPDHRSGHDREWCAAVAPRSASALRARRSSGSIVRRGSRFGQGQHQATATAQSRPACSSWLRSADGLSRVGGAPPTGRGVRAILFWLGPREPSLTARPAIRGSLCLKPSDGLEPSTPSLPWRIKDGSSRVQTSPHPLGLTAQRQTNRLLGRIAPSRAFPLDGRKVDAVGWRGGKLDEHLAPSARLPRRTRQRVPEGTAAEGS